MQCGTAVEERTVLITGSTSGIGLGIARRFADAGYRIMLHGLEENGPELARSLAESHDTDVRCSRANLLEASEISGLIGEIETAFGRLDIVVNNAGIQHVAPVEDFSPEKWNNILALNLTAPFLIGQAAWAGMRERRWGRIINIGSVHGLVASEGKAAYVSAKHGLVGLTKVMALEGAPHGITCNTICPGWVKTPLVDKQIADQAASRHLSEAEVVEKILLAKQAIKAFVPVDSIADTALFLASDSAALITGVAVPIDGGWISQ